MILSCCLLSYWAQTYGFRWILNRSDETKSWASRVIIAGALEGARASCRDGALSEDSQAWFHPKVPADIRNLACALDRASLQQLSAPDKVAGERLSEIGQAQIAESFGLDPTLCYRYATDTFSVVGCFDPAPEPGSLPYEIIDLSLAEP